MLDKVLTDREVDTIMAAQQLSAGERARQCNKLSRYMYVKKNALCKHNKLPSQYVYGLRERLSLFHYDIDTLRNVTINRLTACV